MAEIKRGVSSAVPVNSRYGAGGVIAKAFRDMKDGLAMVSLWSFLGWRHVARNYSRSVLGPLWLTLSMGVMVLSLGLLYSQIYKINVAEYLPFLAVGFILWNLIGGSITESCHVFSGSGHFIRQTNLPLTIYSLRTVCTQLIIFAHNFIIYIVVALIFQIWPGPVILLLLPALLIIAINCLFAGMILGPLCARYRDVPLIIASLVQVAFFLTPILWRADLLPERAYFVRFNPFYHFLEIARAPLLGGPIHISSWIVCLMITAVHGTVAFWIFARVRSRIAYWV
ncbi:ABC transporter permease [Rhizobium sp. CFBP 8762]|uniref:ABC transporter permease n=1 Tax=Rhizobium sp. CFBP 8762 TaxID=2775279 RepID=UPI00177C7901|nr:ABC transporter permease [Rhizobium sp. CFBP 8762]MBD8555636.1 ABC transporter permease [Rhizobium sp. CFBP 8762]